MAINLLDWRPQRQWQLIRQWLVMNLSAMVVAIGLWAYVHPIRTPECTAHVPITVLPRPTHTLASAANTTWHWANAITRLLQQWPKSYQLNALAWQPQGIHLSGQCRYHCSTAPLLHFCSKNHLQLQHMQWHHASYQFDLYHAHPLPLS